MSVTLTQYKTKNQLFADFISITKSALQLFNIQGWEVRQLEQLYKINVLRPSIYISIQDNRQLGSQYNKNNKTEISKDYSSKQEVTIRFSASRRGLESDSVSTFDGFDILKIIKEFIQSQDGISALKELSYAQYRSSEIQEQNFLNDSDNFQFLPFFTCTFLYTNSWKKEINKITKIHTKIQGI